MTHYFPNYFPSRQESDPLLDLDLEGINLTTEDDFFLDEAAGMALA